MNATRDRFTTVAARSGVPSEFAESVIEKLLSCYSEPHRYYHNLSHIDKMLGWLDRTCHSDAIELAIWFHDCIYEPLVNDNEAESAAYFREHLGGSVAFADDVARLILATDPSRDRTGEADENLLVDIDLSILGASPQEYEEFRLSVRKEYAVVPEDVFRKGRRAVMERFLEKKIYTTEYFEELESRARENIERELTSLTI